MWHYIKAAFWAPLYTRLLGALPLNFLMVLGFFILGLAELIRFGHAGFWLLGAGLEVAYLFLLATHPRFQKWVDSREVRLADSEAEAKREALKEKLHGAARRRLDKLGNKIEQALESQRESQDDTFTLVSTGEALNKLHWMYLKLLLGEMNLVESTDLEVKNRLTRQIQALESEMASSELSDSARESKKATLDILLKRLENFRQRTRMLKEIQSDLTRIEAQVDLALETATLRGTPQVIPENIELMSSLLQDGYYGDMESMIADVDREFA